MRKNDENLNTGLSTLNEAEALNSCISKYFKGKSDSLPLKEDESLILSALTIYFHGVSK